MEQRLLSETLDCLMFLVFYTLNVFILEKVTESAIPSPLSAYGRQKLAAENIVLNANRVNLVIRTSVSGATTLIAWHTYTELLIFSGIE